MTEKIPKITYKNHLIFGYNKNAFVTRKKKEDEWFLEYGPISRLPFSWKEECIHTAKVIREQTGLPIKVLFSGGWDSNVVMESFRLAGIPVSAVIVKMKNYNLHDIRWAVEYCETYNIKMELLELDILHFLENELFVYGDLCQLVSPQFLVPVWAMDQIDGFPIIGLGELFLQREIGTDFVYDSDNEKHRLFSRFLISRKRDGAPEFFKYTPELKLSHLIDPETRYWAKNSRKLRHISTVKYKHELYSKHFSLPRRPVYNGFEKLQKYDKMYRRQLERKFGGAQQIIKTEYKDQIKKIFLNSNMDSKEYERYL